MLRRRGRDSELAWVFGAAVRAAASDRDARSAARSAVAAGGGRQAQMLAAVRFALIEAPCEPLAALPLAERETIGLARILGMDVDDIAQTLDCDRAEVKARMRRGLSRLAGPVAVGL